VFEAVLQASAKRTLRRPTQTRDGTLLKLLPFFAVPEVCLMKRENDIPYYAPDGTSLGFRSVESAKRLVAGNFVQASYGRKGHLKAIWSRKQDGSNPVETRAQSGTRYSFPEKLDSGRQCWKLRRLDRRDDDGTLVNTRGIFLQVVVDCLAK
jgi:hypothetical protein